MKIDWSAYKITLLLYLGVLFLPVSFYFSYSSFNEINSDAKVLNRLTLNSALVLSLNDTKDSIKKERTIKKIELTFEELRPWMVENDSKAFYVGSTSLLKKYDLIVYNWKNISSFKETKSLIFSLNNMLELKQNKIYYIFYINLFVTMALLLALIFFTRAYIHQQLSKHAIYDLKTNLHTKDYLLITLKEIIAKTNRTKEELSALYINVGELKNVDGSKKDKLLEYVGESLLDSLRLSDIACRYGENEFIVILPNTKEENFEILTKRLCEDLSQIECDIKATQYNDTESNDDFLARLT